MVSVNSYIRTPASAEYIKEHRGKKDKNKCFYSFLYTDKEDMGNGNYIYTTYLIYICNNIKPLPNQLLIVDSISGAGLYTYTSSKNGKTYNNVVMFVCVKEFDNSNNGNSNGAKKKKYNKNKSNNGNTTNNNNNVNSKQYNTYSPNEISNELDDIPF